MLRLLVVFLLLILVHLQFPLGVLRLAALLGFPCWLLFSEWQTVREVLLFLLCPDGCRHFIGVRGVGSFFRAFGFQEVGAVLLPDPFRRFSVPPLAGLEGQGCGDWVVGLLRLDYCLPFLGTPHVPLFPSQCLIPAPSPSQGLLWGKSPWSWLFRLLWSLLHSLLHPRGCSGEYLLGLGYQGCSGACSTPFSRLLQPSVRSVVDLGVMAFGHHPLPSPSLCGRVTLSVGVHSVCAPVSKSGGLAGLLRSQGSVHSSASSSCFSSLSSLLVT